MSYVFQKPTVSESYPAIGGGVAYDADAYVQAVDTSHPAGGSVTKADADVVVSSVDELDDGVAAGTTVWLEEGVYNTGSRQWTFDADDVTIASDRGIDGSDGALFQTDQRVRRLIELTGDGSRVTGLHIEGPEPDSFGSDGYPAASGIAINGADGEVDNCVVRGWTFAGIEVGSAASAESSHIHHCDIVDTNSKGLGYGVVCYRGAPLIRACYFDNNRHSVAGGGGPDSGWTTTDCIAGPHDRLHAWDMHADGTGNAGTRMVIERSIMFNTHNWYSADGPSEYRQEAAWIRGIPREAFVVRYTAWRGRKPAEPMRDSDNAAFNVRHASTFSEGKVEGVDLCIYEWADGDALSEGMGPTRETAITGYDAGGKRDGSGGEDGTTDDSSDSTGDSMENPTSGKTGTYRVKVHGNGSTRSTYILIGRGGLNPIEDTMEDNDRAVGRAALGRVSTISDTYEVTGPVDTFERVGGDSGIELEVDGTRYPPEAFEASGDNPAAQLALGTLEMNGTSYDVSIDYREQSGG